MKVTYLFPDTDKIKIEKYIINTNELHRIDGPAYTEYDEDGNIIIESYHINGQNISKEYFYQLMINQLLIDHGYYVILYNQSNNIYYKIYNEIAPTPRSKVIVSGKFENLQNVLTEILIA